MVILFYRIPKNTILTGRLCSRFCLEGIALWYEGVFVVSYLRGAFGGQDYCDNIKTEGAVIDIVGREKIAGGFCQSVLLGGRDGRFGRLEVFIGPGPDFDEDDGPVGSDHNKVDFTGFAVEITGESF